MWAYGIYNPFINNTKMKFKRLFGINGQQYDANAGYFKNFYQTYQKKTQGTFSFQNPFTASKQKVKWKIIYYVGLIIAFIMVFKALPMIFANMISGPKGGANY